MTGIARALAYHGRESADEEYDAGDTSGQKSGRATGQPEVLKDVANVVQDGVNAAPPGKDCQQPRPS